MRRLLALAAVVITSAFALSAVAQAGDPDTAHYPDLQTLKPTDVRLVRDRSAGQKLLRFSNTVANLGQGVLELRPVNNAVTGKTEAYQRVYTHDASGGWYLHSESPVGTFEFHSAHNHWHLEGFATYELRNVNPDGSVGATVYASSGKVSFCVIDIVSVAPALEHAGSQTYRTCNQTAVQGLSVGWGDTYTWNLAGQSLNVSSVRSGTYYLVSTADPGNILLETSDANNTAAVKVQFKGNSAKVIP